VLLLDRLDADAEAHWREPHRIDAFRAQEWSDLRSAISHSVAREIQDLLNTRLSPGHWEPISEPQTVIDYGIPDFSALSATDVSDRRILADVIVGKIAAFEPRLSHVRLEFKPHPTDPAAMVGTVEASLTLENLTQPVCFPLEISNRGEVAVLPGTTP
jgi:type VI secretion system lysozyme-like protein